MSYDSTTLVRNLTQVSDSLQVWNVDTALLRLTWTIAQCNIGMRDGYPFGWIQYVDPEAGRRLVVAVRWNQLEGQLQCFATTRPSVLDEYREVERDARLRVGSLLAAYGSLGAELARHSTAQEDLLRSAGLFTVRPRPRCR